MYFPGPEQDLYLNLISPWGTIPEYKSQYHSKRGEYRQIPILQGCPFRIAYAVTSYISQDSTPYNDIPFYLCFQVVINGKKVGEPVIINQRNKEECSGYLTGLSNGVSGGEVEWSKFYQPLWQRGTTNAKGKDIKPFNIVVYVYRCSVSRKKGGEGTNMPSGYCKTLHNEPQGSFVQFNEERCVFSAERLHGNGEPVVQYEWETTVLNPRSTLLGNYKWYCHDPSIATHELKTITTSKAEHNLPVYSKGSKTSFVHKIGPPLKRDWDSNHTSMVRFKERMKATKFSPLRSSFLADAEENISGVILSGPTQKLRDKAQITPLTSPNLDIGSGNLWRIGISRTGQVKYYTKSTPNNSSKAKATPRLARHEWPYMHKYMTRGWEKRYINRKPYFFDHNTGCTQRKDPRLIKNTITPVDPCPNIVPLQKIREELDYYTASQLMVTGLIDTPSCSIYRQDSQLFQETFIVDYKNMESLLSIWNVYTSEPAQQDSPAVDALYSRTTGDSPTTSSSTEDSPTTGSPTEDSPTTDSLTVDSLAVDLLTADSPTKHSPTTDSLTMDTPTVDSPAMDPPTKDSPAVDPLTTDSPAMDSSTKDSLTTDPLTADSLATDSLAANSLTTDSPAIGASTFVESSKHLAPINQLINKTLEAMGRIQTPAENSIKDLLNMLRRPQVKKGEKRETTSSDEGDKKRVGKRKRTPSDEGDKTGMGGKKKKSDYKEDKKGGVKRVRTFSDDEDKKGRLKRKRNSIDKEDQQGETKKKRTSITKEDQKGETKKKGISIDKEDQKEEIKKRGASSNEEDQKGGVKRKRGSSDEEDQKEEVKRKRASVMRNTKKE